MTQNFSFEVNIEERMPQSGKVFFVNRMTSDYALAHPFDVDGFIEQVFQKYEQMAQDDPQNFGRVVHDREQLRRLWNLVLQMPERGDKSLYPNDNGQQPALMEVWHKAGDFWRRGLRLGDTMPDVVPPCKITRLDGGEWIALFPKDMPLLNVLLTDSKSNSEVLESEVERHLDGASADAPLPSNLFSEDITAMMNIEDRKVCPTPPASETKRPRRLGRPLRSQQSDVMQLYGSPAITIEHVENEHSERNRKIFAAVATAIVFLILINTVGLFGIAAIGLLAGGILK